MNQNGDNCDIYDNRFTINRIHPRTWHGTHNNNVNAQNQQNTTIPPQIISNPFSVATQSYPTDNHNLYAQTVPPNFSSMSSNPAGAVSSLAVGPASLISSNPTGAVSSSVGGPVSSISANSTGVISTSAIGPSTSISTNPNGALSTSALGQASSISTHPNGAISTTSNPLPRLNFDTLPSFGYNPVSLPRLMNIPSQSDLMPAIQPQQNKTGKKSKKSASKKKRRQKKRKKSRHSRKSKHDKKLDKIEGMLFKLCGDIAELKRNRSPSRSRSRSRSRGRDRGLVQ